ncbi:hypothetical protein [Deminuibacter soli]|nr:hypothetical protein [Deminuibacter soli]
MRTVIAITLLSTLLQFHRVNAQEANTAKELEKAKAAVKGSDGEAPDYNTAGLLLEKIVAREPGNAEAWYWLGYAIDKTNAPDGEHMPHVKLALTVKASEAFEKSLLPGKDVYTGEIYIQDPHTKILAVWGTQAMYYLYNGQKDSAVWCYQQAAHKGGLNRTVMNYFRQVLDECPHNSWLFFNGDMYLYYLNSLQLAEKYRPDVDCIDLNLLNTKWYPGWMASKGLLQTSHSPVDLAAVERIKWTTTQTAIVRGHDTLISWALQPTDDKKYLSRSARLLLDLLQQNAFRKEVYFAADVPQGMSLYLDSFFQFRGLTNRLVSKTKQTDMPFVMEQLRKLDDLPETPRTYLNNHDNVQVLNNYRFAFASAALIALRNGDKATAKQLLGAVERKYPEHVLPFFATATRDWFQQLKKKVAGETSLE